MQAYECSTHKGQKMASDPPGLEFTVGCEAPDTELGTNFVQIDSTADSGMHT